MGCRRFEAWGFTQLGKLEGAVLEQRPRKGIARAINLPGLRRAACVGCGTCAHVCPRGVLKLENKPDRFKGGTPIRVYAVDL